MIKRMKELKNKEIDKFLTQEAIKEMQNELLQNRVIENDDFYNPQKLIISIQQKKNELSVLKKEAFAKYDIEKIKFLKMNMYPGMFMPRYAGLFLVGMFQTPQMNSLEKEIKREQKILILEFKAWKKGKLTKIVNKMKEKDKRNYAILNSEK